VTCKEGEEEGEEDDDDDEGESAGGIPLQLEPMGNMGMPTYLKLSARAFQQSNLAAITSALSIVTEILKSTNSEDLPIDILRDSQVGICLVEFGYALSLSS
jgi:hypothetical protein